MIMSPSNNRRASVNVMNEGGSFESSMMFDSDFEDQDWKNELKHILSIDYSDFGQITNETSSA